MDSGNATPLEILWALMFTIAFGNFLTELRQCIKDLRNLNRVARASLLLPSEVGSRRIYIRRTIAAQCFMLGVCFFLGAPGWYLMTQPQAGPNNSPTPSAIAISASLVIAGVLVVVYSVSVRYFTRMLRQNLLWRKRHGDPADAIDYEIRRYNRG